MSACFCASAPLTLSGFPSEIAAVMEQPPTVASLAQVSNWLNDHLYSSSFWLNFSAENAQQLKSWLVQNTAHKWGGWLMIGAGTAAGLVVATAVGTLAGQGPLVNSFIAVGAFLLVFLLVVDVLYMPMAPFWNRHFGCLDAHRIKHRMSVVPNHGIHSVQEQLAGNSEALRYLTQVAACRPMMFQDVTVARAITAQT